MTILMFLSLRLVDSLLVSVIFQAL